MSRNAHMIDRIESLPVEYPLRFTILGDSGAGPNPVGDMIFSSMLDQMAQIDPAPAFMVNIGDFAGPGTPERHSHYETLVEGLSIPNLCLSGNHDCDHPDGFENFRRIHGEHNFQFSYGSIRFICINGHGGPHIPGPQVDDLAYLEKCLREDEHSIRVVMLHMPPNFNGRYAPHPEWGFKQYEQEFLRLIDAYDVQLVCCAHVLAYDHLLDGKTHFVISGGGGWGVCTHYGVCTYGWDAGVPPHHGAFYHFVEITVEENGEVHGRVFRACEGTSPDTKYHF